MAATAPEALGETVSRMFGRITFANDVVTAVFGVATFEGIETATSTCEVLETVFAVVASVVTFEFTISVAAVFGTTGVESTLGAGALGVGRTTVAAVVDGTTETFGGTAVVVVGGVFVTVVGTTEDFGGSAAAVTGVVATEGAAT